MQQTQGPLITNYPKGVVLIALTQMWESFSYFGMRVLLVLYLIAHLKFSEQNAFIVYTLYIGLVQIFAVVGGYLVDRLLNRRFAVIFSGSLILLGHILLALSGQGILLYLSLSFIIFGSSIFRVSLQSLLGQLYDNSSEKREKGFTLLYVGMNLGGLSAAILCGFAAQFYGWHAGFGLAAFGMAVGLFIFYTKSKGLKLTEDFIKVRNCMKICALSCVALFVICFFLMFFPITQYAAAPLGLIASLWIFYKLKKTQTKVIILKIAGVMLLLMLYFAAESLWGSLLMVFSEMHVNRNISGVMIPSAVIAAMNPLVIILIGPLIAKTSLKLFSKFILAFLCLSLAFFLFYMMNFMPHPSALYFCLGLGLIALGEVLLAPSAQAYIYQTISGQSPGFMMGAITLFIALGTIISGKIAKIPLEIHYIFLSVAGISLFVATLLGIILSKSYKQEN